METFWHLVECPHPEWQQLFKNLCTALAELHKQLTIDPHLLQMLKQDLTAVQLNYLHIPQTNDYLLIFTNYYSYQQCIGQDQLFYRRFVVPLLSILIFCLCRCHDADWWPRKRSKWVAQLFHGNYLQPLG